MQHLFTITTTRALVAVFVVVGTIVDAAEQQHDANSIWIGLPENYQNQTALQKSALLQDRIFGSLYANDNNNKRPVWTNTTFQDLLDGAIARSLRPAFTCNLQNSDVLPIGRVRYLHTLGVVGLIRLDMTQGGGGGTSSSFTGLLAPGAVTFGVARLSIAMNPALLGFAPGMGLKLFIDGQPSVNVVGINHIDGQGKDVNFFKNFFRTNVPGTDIPASQSFTKNFKEVDPTPTLLPVRELAEFTNTGQRVKDPKSPSVLKFVPHERIANLISGNSTNDFRDDLTEKVTPGPLYYVYAAETFDDPNAKLTGLLTLTTKLVQSEFGDARLCFRHQHSRAFKPANDEIVA